MNLSISEVFESIQGESSFTGCLTTFIRLAGCPLQCSWCDTPQGHQQGKHRSFDELLACVEQFGWRHVCITGGEPLAQINCIPFLELLLERNYTVSLETNGAVSTAKVPKKVHVILDIKCPGSGMAEQNHWPNLDLLRPHDEVKFVVANKDDFVWALSIISNYNLPSKVSSLLLSPVWGILDPKELISWMLISKMPLRLNLQTHKYVGAL